nr:hypothetical protein GCM10020092_005740 [Actinoplanes digitatis]
MTAPTPVSGEGGADAYARLAEMGLTLPTVVPPLASYVPAVQSGNYVYVSGQLPMVDGKLPYVGKVGADVTIEQGAELARYCALNALAAIDSLVGLGLARQDRQGDRLRGVGGRLHRPARRGQRCLGALRRGARRARPARAQRRRRHRASAGRAGRGRGHRGDRLTRTGTE